MEDENYVVSDVVSAAAVAWAEVVDRCSAARARPTGASGREPREGRQHTASAFSSA